MSFPAFAIVGGVTKLIPLTGVTLPFHEPGRLLPAPRLVIVALLLRAGDEATGRSSRVAGRADLATARLPPPPCAVPTCAAPALDTPESGLLGRVALTA